MTSIDKDDYRTADSVRQTDLCLVESSEHDTASDQRSELICLMNQWLASAVDLQRQIQQAQWNVKGPQVLALQELFGRIDEAVQSYVDLIAMRIVDHGGVAEGTIRVTAMRTRLRDYPQQNGDWMSHVDAVAVALSSFGEAARSVVDSGNDRVDVDTANLFTGVSRGVDQWLWCVKVHSQEAK